MCVLFCRVNLPAREPGRGRASCEEGGGSERVVNLCGMPEGAADERW